MLRNGQVGNGVPQFGKVVGVGHCEANFTGCWGLIADVVAYGSFLLTGSAASYPEAFDQLVLTGFSNNVTSGQSTLRSYEPMTDPLGPLGLPGFQATIASVAYPERFGSLPNDYVITPSVSNDQIGFFQ